MFIVIVIGAVATALFFSQQSVLDWFATALAILTPLRNLLTEASSFRSLLGFGKPKARDARTPARRERVVALALIAVMIAAAVIVRYSEEDSLTIAIHQGVEGVALTTLARRSARETRLGRSR
jgi:hypothetical protein